MHRHYWRHYEQNCLQVHAVRISLLLYPKLEFVHLTNSFLTRISLKHVAEGGSVAEEVISTIRTAQAFGTQKILAELYDSHIEQSHVVDVKAAVVHGCGLSVFFFVIYSAYALAFSFGTTLLIHGHATVGIIVNVFIAILIGSFSLALLAPEMQGELNYEKLIFINSMTDHAIFSAFF